MTRPRLTTRLLVAATLMTGSLGLGTGTAQGAVPSPATRAAAAPTTGAIEAATTPATGAPATGAPGKVVERVRTADDDAETPLRVTLNSMSPAEIPPRGAITLTGTVTNRTDEEWTDINVAPFVGQQPITTRDDLDEAARTGPEVSVGNRLTNPGTYATFESLAPRRSAAFSVRIPVSSLRISGDPGVYWIGIHALGTSLEGRDSVADGRARTFIPLVPRAVARRTTVPVSVVLPLRERARRSADGSLEEPERWVRLTSATGRLRRLVDFAASAGDAPVTWLVDPAVLDALGDFSRGNPGLSFGPQQRADESESPSPEPSPEPSREPSPEPSPAESPDPSLEQQPSDQPSQTEKPARPPEDATQGERERAADVLNDLVASARTHPLLTLGYADPDVVSLARHRPGLISRADSLAAQRLAVRELTGTPTVAPPSGYFDPDVLAEVPEDSLLLLPDRGRVNDPVRSTLLTGQPLVLTDERASRGGPSPLRARDPLALRQRVLAEAALEATSGSAAPRPVVLMLPPRWSAGARWRQADFFGGLDTEWLRLAPLPSGPSAAFDGELPYGEDQLADEVGVLNVMATRGLARTSTVLGNLLANENSTRERLTGAALQASSYAARNAPRLAAARAVALDVLVRERMRRVQVTGTDFVTLSGGSGSLTVTLVNGLKQPITVGLRARTESTRVAIDTPDPVNMQPGERTTLRLQVTSSVGVHDVTLFPVTTEGEITGTPLDFSLRTSEVGRLIWYILIAGGTLLTVMIIRRILLRIRDHRWRPEEAA